MENIKLKIPVNPSWPFFQPKTSSQVKTAVYDPKGEMMYVEFQRNGSVYSYHPVKAKTFEAFEASPSAGSYFHSHFKRTDKLKVRAL